MECLYLRKVLMNHSKYAFHVAYCMQRYFTVIVAFYSAQPHSHHWDSATENRIWRWIEWYHLLAPMATGSSERDKRQQMVRFDSSSMRLSVSVPYWSNAYSLHRFWYYCYRSAKLHIFSYPTDLPLQWNAGSQDIIRSRSASACRRQPSSHPVIRRFPHFVTLGLCGRNLRRLHADRETERRTNVMLVRIQR